MTVFPEMKFFKIILFLFLALTVSCSSPGSSSREETLSESRASTQVDPDKVIFLKFAAAGEIEEIKYYLSTSEKKAPQDYLDEALMTASINGQIEVMEFLITDNANVNTRLRGSRSPILSETIYARRPEAVDYLLAHGANVNHFDRYGQTPLGKAVETDEFEIAQKLITRGADINFRSSAGNTVLMDAARNGKTNFVKLLLKKGATVNLTDQAGLTALMVAAFNGQLNAVRALIDAGADFKIKDSENHTALSLAKQAFISAGEIKKENFRKVINLLEKKGAK